MGSLAFALGGGLAGAGQGLAEVGREASTELREQGITRLRAEYEAQQQQRGFGEQEKLQAKTQQFEREQTQQQLQAHGGIAKAEMAQKEKLAGEHEAAATERTKLTGQYRVAARQAGNKPEAQPKTWTKGSYNMAPTVAKDGSITPGGSVQTYQHNPSGRVFVQAGDKWLLHDETQPGLPSAANVRNAPAKATQDLMADPNGDTPDGRSKMDAYLEAYKQLPGGYFDAVRRAQPAGPAGGPLGKNAPAGSKFQEQESFGGGNAKGDAQDTADDAEDYANTGDEGPQERDNTPAQ